MVDRLQWFGCRVSTEMNARVLLTMCALALAAVTADAQTSGDPGGALMQRADVRAALDAARADEPHTVEEQIRLCEIPAPPFKEERRGRALADAFRSAGLRNVRIDAAGNVIGERPGRAAHPNVVFSAHLDTVFPEGTDVHVTRDGTVLKGPGIGDDCRGLTVLLSIVRALDAARIETPGTITFVATVGEEGLGDLRGVKTLFRDTLAGQIDRFVSIDGSGYGITHRGVGSRRYRVTFKGPGGHSYGAFGIANPAHALGRAIAAFADVQVPSEPKTTFAVGRVGGGTSVNAIPFDAWMEVDMRSIDPAALATLEKSLLAAVDAAVEGENRRWNRSGALTVDKQLVGDRPAGLTAEQAPIVQAAVSVTRALGLPVTLDESSTDSNTPMSLGIPAITIDAGGRGTGSHALEETFDTVDSWKGTQRALLLAIALAQ
jgi:acetylornithine deacetylase/succinyl-diaminopimelate desuccinylase-like protein